MSVEHRPERRAFRDSCLPGTARERQRKESASQNRRFNLLNHLQMIWRPCKRIGLREIALAEKLEIAFAGGFPVGIHNLRERADVTSGERLFRLTVALGVATLLIAARAGRLLRCVFPVEHPGNVFQEVDVARILGGTDPEADAVELAVKPRLRQNKSERCGVQKPRDVHYAHVTRIDHRIPPKLPPFGHGPRVRFAASGTLRGPRLSDIPCGFAVLISASKVFLQLIIFLLRQPGGIFNQVDRAVRIPRRTGSKILGNHLRRSGPGSGLFQQSHQHFRLQCSDFQRIIHLFRLYFQIATG